MTKGYLGGVLALLAVSGAGWGQTPTAGEWKPAAPPVPVVLDPVSEVPALPPVKVHIDSAPGPEAAPAPASSGKIGSALDRLRFWRRKQKMDAGEGDPNVEQVSAEVADNLAKESAPLPGGLPLPDGEACAEDHCFSGHGWRQAMKLGGSFYGGAEYLLWWPKGYSLPPLLTTSPFGTPQGMAGVLGAPGTTTVIGGAALNDDLRSGVRFTLGYWLNPCQTCGIEANFFILEDRTAFECAGSPGCPILARPFTNAATGRPDSQLIAFPNVVAGAVTVSSRLSDVLGAEVLGRKNLCCGCWYRVDAVGGYRFLKMEEGLDINESLTSLPGQPLVTPGTVINVGDSFETCNEFHGGELGAVAEFRHNNWSLNVLGKVALGATDETVSINGGTAILTPGQPTVTHAGGLLAQPTNIGRYERDVFAVVPEFGVTLGYQVTPRLRATAGYTFLYWSDVARPGNQINLIVNPTQIPPSTLVGAAQPAFHFQGSDFWLQGINLGLELRY